jgi:hypothetical protein
VFCGNRSAWVMRRLSGWRILSISREARLLAQPTRIQAPSSVFAAPARQAIAKRSSPIGSPNLKGQVLFAVFIFAG